MVTSCLLLVPWTILHWQVWLWWTLKRNSGRNNDVVSWPSSDSLVVCQLWYWHRLWQHDPKVLRRRRHLQVDRCYHRWSPPQSITVTIFKTLVHSFLRPNNRLVWSIGRIVTRRRRRSLDTKFATTASNGLDLRKSQCCQHR